MRPGFLFALVMCGLAPISASAQEVSAEIDQAELSVARSIIEISLPEEQREATLRMLMGAITSQLSQASNALPPNADEGLREIFDEFLASVPDLVMPVATKHMPQILEATATAYTSEFSLAELQEIHAFALTPAGRHFFESSAGLVSHPAVAEANTAYFADLQIMDAEAQKGLRAQIGAYLAEHPDALKPAE